MAARKNPKPGVPKDPDWTPTQVQFLYRHKNGRYYVRTFARGKEKWTSLRTTLMSVARNRMKPHVEAAQRERTTGPAVSAGKKMTFGQALAEYRRRLKSSVVRPNTKAYREAGLKLVLRSWPGIEDLGVRRITPDSVCAWFRRFRESAVPYVPKGAKSPARNSTGASLTTLKCALDAVRLVLDVAFEAGHLHANPARDGAVRRLAAQVLRAARRQRAERGPAHVPTRNEFSSVIAEIRSAGTADAREAADFLSFIAYSGARKSEAANATWADVDFDRANITLRKTKTGDSRVVPMFSEMRALLERMRSERDDITPTSPLFKIAAAQGSIDAACARLGAPRFTHHALRAMFGTTCLEASIDVRTVAEWLGHKDHGALLLKTYSHVRAQHEREMIAKVNFGGDDPIVT